MHPAGRDGLDTAAQTRHINRDIVIYLCAVTQLAKTIPSPALDAPCRGQSAGVKPAGCDGLDTATQTRHINRDIAIYLCAVAQLTKCIVPPAFDAPRRSQGACVRSTGRDGLDAVSQALHVHRGTAIGLCTVT